MWSARAIEHYRTCISAQRIFSNDVEIARLLLQHRSRAAWNCYLYYSIEYPKSQHQAKFEVFFLVFLKNVFSRQTACPQTTQHDLA